MKPQTYPSARAFRQALDQRLRNLGGGAQLEPLRQSVAYDRFLARVVAEFGEAAILKGGVGLGLRVPRARTTKDVDLRITDAPDRWLARLQNAAERPFDDFLTFTLGRDAAHPMLAIEGMEHAVQRFRVEASIDGKLFARPFGVDVAIGDALVGEIETVQAPDLLGFAGIAPPQLRLYPLESHVAEKLHAYTLPRPRPNSRVKDLPDIALLASARAVDGALLREALAATFAARQSHPLPKMLPEPPSSWELPYAAMAAGDELPWPTLAAVTAAARGFLDPPLLGHGVRWEPQQWRWV
jgi:hypothetical protein